MSIAGAYGLKGFKAGLQDRLSLLRAPSLSSLGCVLYIPGNRISAGLTPDLSGKGNNGINHGSVLTDIGKTYPLKWKNRIIDVGGKALSFDGVDDYVNCGNDEILDITNAITLEGWVKIYAFVNVYPKIIAKASQYQAMLEASSKKAGITFYIAGGWKNLYLDAVLLTNTWYYVVGTFDSSLGSDQQKIYINGVLGNQRTQAGTISSTANNVLIGDYEGSVRYFDGLIAEGRIYNRALSAREIADHYRILKPLFN